MKLTLLVLFVLALVALLGMVYPCPGTIHTY